MESATQLALRTGWKCADYVLRARSAEWQLRNRLCS